MCKSGGWHFVFGVVAALSVLTALESVVFAVPPAQAQSGGGIKSIRVEGNKRVEPETVRTYLRFNVGDAYDPAKVNQSIKSLFATGLFSDVRIVREGAGVVVTVVENPIVNQVAFEGNREVDKATLTTEVQLKPRSVFTRAKAQADVQRILDIYRRQGRFAAAVDPKIIELDNNRVNVVFEINEGGATKVQAINFIGNKAFSDSQLRDIISTSQSGLFDFLKGTNIYDPDRLALDRELLRQYYLKNGYADARVVSAGAELARDGSGFYLTFVVDEGEPFKFGKIDVESSLPGVEPNTLRGEVQTAAGATYDQSAMDRTVERLTLTISERGFAFARVRPRAVREPGTRVINITYVVDQGPRIYIERINVSGNLRTHDHVIRREFQLAEGDAYNPLLVDKAKKRLQALGFFKSVEIKRHQGSAPDRVVLDVDLVEQSTGELSFGAGYSTSEGIIGDVSISERNLLGKGQFLRLRLAGSFERLQADISFTEPRFLDRNLSAGFDLFWKELDFTDVAGFKSRVEGGSLRLGFPLSENLWLTNTYTLSNGTIFDVNDNASLVIKGSEGTDLTSAYGFSLAYDQRNHPKNPTAGYYLQVGTDFAGLGGDVRYIRNTAEARVYFPITQSLTFAGRAIGGHIMGWGGDDVRLLDLFFKGGETIRGFDRAGIGPRDLNTDDALGGDTFWATTAEVRFPMPFVPEDLGLGGAFFVDAGSLFGAGQFAKDLAAAKACAPGDRTTVCLVDASTIRASAGFSIIWNSPLGPLRLDIAKAFLKEGFDREQLVRFGASTKF
ncbi:MAG: outer membrane protein assembly factor BamA [Hyphomicrobiaceae bacterium]|nr:outer membrane protein assembly factor BamA [Hyphomicrobiaceae bacterium]